MISENRRKTNHENEAEKGYEREYNSETEVIEKYQGVLEMIINHKPEFQLLSGQNVQPSEETPDHPEVAYRIILNEPTGKEQQVGIFDWDDTLEKYTEKKNLFYSSIFALCDKSHGLNEENFIEICEAINRACRILPVTGTHPEKYSSILELATITELIEMINNNENLDLLKKNKINPAEEFKKKEKERAELMARNFISNNILDKFNGQVEMSLETKDGAKKLYFKESKDQATALNFDKKPNFISQEVWDIHNEKINQCNIGEDEYANFDIDENNRFVVSSFGEAGFQLEKICNAIKKLSEHHVRIPDEIIITTRGDKKPIFENLIANVYQKMQIIFVDDNPKNLKDLGSSIIPICATREHSKRSGVVIPPDMEVHDIDHIKHSELMKFAQGTSMFSQGERIDYTKRKKVKNAQGNEKVKAHYVESQENVYELYNAMEEGTLKPCLVFDLDGVLVKAGVDTASSDETMDNYVLKNNENISDFQKRIVDLQKLGFKVGICTGRGFSFANKLIEKIFPNESVDYAICEGGAVIYSYEYKNGEVDKKRIINGNMDANSKKILTDNREELISQISNECGGELEAGKELGLSFNMPKGMNKIEDYYQLIKKNLKKSDYLDFVNITHSSTAVDITPKGVDKMDALKDMLKDDVLIYFGDEKNDERAMKNSTVNVIPGNGRYSTKDMAKSSEFGIVAGKQEINGVADALRIIQLFMRHAKSIKHKSSMAIDKVDAI